MPSDGIDVTPLTHPDGAPLINPVAINHRGQVVSLDATIMVTDVFVWDAGEVGQIDIGSSGAAMPYDLSDKGEVVGSVGLYFGYAAPWLAAYTWQDGELTPLPIPGNPQEDPPYEPYIATSVNDHGQVLVLRALRRNPEDLRIELELTVWDGKPEGEAVAAPAGTPTIPFESIYDDVLDALTPPRINNRGQVAATVKVGDSWRGVLWDVHTGEVTDLGTLGGEMTRVRDLNGRGMVTGTSTTADGEEHAFLWHKGEMTDLGTLGGGTSDAVALNEWGQVVGTSTTTDGGQRAFLAYAGEITQIDPLGGSSLTPLDLNNWGQVVGTSETTGGQHQAFLWQNGRITNLGELADPDQPSWAIDINDRGQIIGTLDPLRPTNPPNGTLLFPYPLGRGHGLLWKVSPLWGYTEAS